MISYCTRALFSSQTTTSFPAMTSMPSNSSITKCLETTISKTWTIQCAPSSGTRRIRMVLVFSYRTGKSSSAQLKTQISEETWNNKIKALLEDRSRALLKTNITIAPSLSFQGTTFSRSSNKAKCGRFKTLECVLTHRLYPFILPQIILSSSFLTHSWALSKFGNFKKEAIKT